MSGVFFLTFAVIFTKFYIGKRDDVKQCVCSVNVVISERCHIMATRLLSANAAWSIYLTVHSEKCEQYVTFSQHILYMNY